MYFTFILEYLAKSSMSGKHVAQTSNSLRLLPTTRNNKHCIFASYFASNLCAISSSKPKKYTPFVSARHFEQVEKKTPAKLKKNIRPAGRRSYESLREWWTACASPLHSFPLISTPLHSIPFQSTLLHSTPLLSVPLHFIPLHSTPFHSTPFHSNKHHSTPPHQFLSKLRQSHPRVSISE